MPRLPATGRDGAQPHRRRDRCAACGSRFDDLTGTVLAGRHRPLRLWVLCLYLMGLNLSNERGSVRLLWREKRSGV
jgi:transposase-like protein